MIAENGSETTEDTLYLCTVPGPLQDIVVRITMSKRTYVRNSEHISRTARTNHSDKEWLWLRHTYYMKRRDSGEVYEP